MYPQRTLFIACCDSLATGLGQKRESQKLNANKSRIAESAGPPPPQFPPVLSSSSSPSASVPTGTSDPLSSAARKSPERKTERYMPREEAEVEDRAAAMEAKQDENNGREIEGCRRGRREREKGEEREREETTVGNWVSGFFWKVVRDGRPFVEKIKF